MSMGGPFQPGSCGRVAPGGSGCGADGCCSSPGREELGKNINADEAAAMGAVYQAAALSKAFKVKPFVVRDAAVFPIQVTLSRVQARGRSGGCWLPPRQEAVAGPLQRQKRIAHVVVVLARLGSLARRNTRF